MRSEALRKWEKEIPAEMLSAVNIKEVNAIIKRIEKNERPIVTLKKDVHLKRLSTTMLFPEEFIIESIFLNWPELQSEVYAGQTLEELNEENEIELAEIVSLFNDTYGLDLTIREFQWISIWGIADECPICGLELTHEYYCPNCQKTDQEAKANGENEANEIESTYNHLIKQV